MARLSMDFATNKTEPKAKTLQRRQSTGSLTIQTSEPNYLKASTGSCHDLCKFGMRRAAPEKPWSPVACKDHGGRKVPASPKLMPSPSRQHVNELLKPKPLKTNRAFSTSSTKIQESRNYEAKDIKTYNTVKNRSPLPLSSPKVRSRPPLSSSPKVPITEIRTTKSSQKKTSLSEIKKRVEKNEVKKTNFENVPEKIIHVVMPDNENRDKGHAQESCNGPGFTTATENWEKATRGARVAPEKLKLGRGKDVENAAGYKNGTLRESVSNGKLIIKRNGDPELMKSVMEERASTMVTMKKGTVEALVRAFESVIIKTQTS